MSGLPLIYLIGLLWSVLMVSFRMLPPLVWSSPGFDFRSPSVLILFIAPWADINVISMLSLDLTVYNRMALTDGLQFC